MNQSYIPEDLNLKSHDAAQKIHRLFQFKPEDTYDGHLCVELRRSANQLSIFVRSDHISREFIYEPCEKTLFEEIFYDWQPYELGSKTTTIVFQKIKRQGVWVRDCAKMEGTVLYSPFEKAKAEWVNAEEAQKVLAIHKYLAANTAPIIRNYFKDAPINGLPEMEIVVSRIREEGSPPTIDGFNRPGIKIGAPRLKDMRWFYGPPISLG